MVDADDTRVSDETLIGRFYSFPAPSAPRDPAAFDRLIRRHQAAVYRFARAAAPAAPADSPALAEEVLRETFLAARRAAARHRDEPSARPWLLALARQAIDRLHPRSTDADATSLRELAGAAGWKTGEDGASLGDGYGGGLAVEAAFAALAPDDREILTLCDREYFTLDEAARVTGLPDAAVRTRLHRARLRLLARLKEGAHAG
jgi:RNA polymerase sigma-70 factor (ECF subfamily)